MFHVHLDLSEILELGDIKQKIEQAAKNELKALAFATHAHIVEEVQKTLHSSREKYLDALSIQPLGDDTWLINLDESAMWIERGLDPHSMVEDLLSSPKAKTSKSGTKYLSVPFEHKKGPTQQTAAQTTLTNTIKSEMRKRDISYGKLEVDQRTGKPKQGLLHSFDIKTSPLKSGNLPGQGKGPIGSVFQGPTGIPFLQGVRVYQKEFKDKKTGKTKVQKSIVTFRTVSSKHSGTDRWFHPGLQAKNFLDNAVEWALREFEDKIKDRIFIAID